MALHCLLLLVCAACLWSCRLCILCMLDASVEQKQWNLQQVDEKIAPLWAALWGMMQKHVMCMAKYGEVEWINNSPLLLLTVEMLLGPSPT